MKKLAPVILKGIRYYPLNIPAGFDLNANRSKRYCKSKSEVLDLKARIRQWKLARKYKPDSIALSDSDKQWITYLHAELGPDLSDLPRVVEHWKLTAASVRRPARVHDMVTRYLAYRERDLGAVALADVRHRCTRFSSMLHDRNVHELAAADIRAFLEIREHQTSRRNDYKALAPMFSWAREQGMLVLNPLSEIKRPKAANVEPGILSPDRFEKILNIADKNYSELLPFLVLAGFAGLRTCELVQERESDEVVQWTDFRGWSVLEIRPEVAKTTSRARGDRRFVRLDAAVKYWIDRLRQDTGRVLDRSQKSFRVRMADLQREAEVQIPNNGLRHSYASYWIAAHRKQGFGELAINMGNSESVAKRHYVDSLHPTDGRKWFGIRRDESSCEG